MRNVPVIVMELELTPAEKMVSKEQQNESNKATRKSGLN